MKSIKTNRRSWLRTLLPYLPKSLRFMLIRKMVVAHYEDPPQLEMRIAQSKEELDAAYRILHDAYVDQGFMTPDPSGMRIIKYFALPSTATLIALWNGRVVGTMSVIRRTSFGLPLENVFDIKSISDNDMAVAEVSSLAIAKDFRMERGALFFPFCKFGVEYCEKYLRLKRLVIAVNPSMSDFYEAVMGFEVIQNKTINSYDFANGNPAVGLWLDFDDFRVKMKKWYGDRKDRRKNLDIFFNKFKFNYIKYPERVYFKATDPVVSSEYLDYFFVQKSNVLAKLSASERKALESLYPEYFRKHHKDTITDMRKGPRIYVEVDGHINGFQQQRVRIIDASEEGVRVQLTPQHFLEMQELSSQGGQSIISMSVEVRENCFAKVSGVVRWFDKSNYSVGIELRQSDSEWRSYLGYLISDLSLRKAS